MMKSARAAVTILFISLASCATQGSVARLRAEVQGELSTAHSKLAGINRDIQILGNRVDKLSRSQRDLRLSVEELLENQETYADSTRRLLKKSVLKLREMEERVVEIRLMLRDSK